MLTIEKMMNGYVASLPCKDESHTHKMVFEDHACSYGELISLKKVLDMINEKFNHMIGMPDYPEIEIRIRFPKDEQDGEGTDHASCKSKTKRRPAKKARA